MVVVSYKKAITLYLHTQPFLLLTLLLKTVSCCQAWTDPTLWTAYVLGHVTVVYLLPGLTVAACHHSVGHKLYAASLAAAAANGDIPLPMPILGRPREVIIVASVQNDAPSKVTISRPTRRVTNYFESRRCVNVCPRHKAYVIFRRHFKGYLKYQSIMIGKRNKNVYSFLTASAIKLLIRYSKISQEQVQF